MGQQSVCRLTLIGIVAVLTVAREATTAGIALGQSNEARRFSVADEPVLTLPLAVEIALRTNPLMRATAAGQQIAEAKSQEAKAGRYPLLQFNQNITRSNNPVFVFGSLLEQARFGPGNFNLESLNSPDSLTNVRTSLSFRLPVFDQRQNSTRITRADLDRQRAEAQDRMVRQKVRFEVLKSFYGWLVSNARKDVADEAVKLSEADVKRARDMFETGIVVQSDLLSAEVQLAEFRQQQIQSEGDLIAAMAAFNTSLGVDIEVTHKLAGELAEKAFPEASQTELLRLAMENRPELVQHRLALRSAQEGKRSAVGTFLPRVELFGGVGLSGQDFISGSSDYTLGATLSFDIFDAGRNARIAQTRANELMATADYEQQAAGVRLEVVRAYQQYISARARVRVASRIVEQAREALRIVQNRYEEGLVTISEVLRAQTSFMRASHTMLAARYDHYAGYGALLLATGRLDSVDVFLQ
jgi:outer membrane protein TolC